MKTYEKYKPSGFEFIGDIPESWNTKKLKFLVSEKLKYGANESAELEDLDQPRYIRITDFGEDGTLRENTFKSLPFEIAKDYFLENGDILFARSGATVGKTFQFKNYEGLACYAGYLIKANPDENQITSDFLYYFTKSNSYESWKDSIFIQATIQNIGADKYNTLQVPLPPIAEQTAIAEYLDEKTAEIDKLIANKGRLIELLKEERTAIINKAVTRGINADAKLKPSGIDWLGDIPEHWEVKRLKFLTKDKLKYGANESAEQENFDHPRYIRITDFGDDGKLRNDTFKSLPFEVAEDYLLKDGDILFARSGATVGKTFQFKNYDGLACFAGYLIKASPNEEEMLSDFLYWFTKSGVYEGWKNSIFNQATIQNIGADKYSCLEIPITKIEEQKEIVEFIESKTNEIDSTISKIEKEIELIKEYRTALISEVVTGKLKVIN